ncbi:MAG: methylenetetrahydrofolate reductase [NAD(P)H] [bacterium]|nr:methylenetetrahydrofolate reductase [NAD(P)H] [bacterium]
MYVLEHLDQAQKPLFSYEIIPPPRGKSARDILDVVEQICSLDPPFIDVTSHSAEARYEELGDGTVRRRVRRKRPGTISICGIIQNRYNIDTVPHLLCRGFTREETEDVMIELNYLGIHNVLAIRGDETNYRRTLDSSRSTNEYAVDLVGQLGNLQKGKYLEDIANSEPINMCIGVGGYPEKHNESPNLKSDIRHLKDKIEAGADYVVTQMFFDNAYYVKFIKECRQAELSVPIIPGIKVINSVRQLTSLPKNFHVTIPDQLVDEIESNPKHVREIGENWAVAQCGDLLNCGARCVHFYIMNDAGAVTRVIKRL